MLRKLARHLHIAWLRLMARRAPELRPQGRVLIIAPHPDDEVFGCGALIARLVADGRPPHVAILTGGEGSHRQCCGLLSTDIIAARRQLTRCALDTLGLPAANIHELDYADGGITDADPAPLVRLIADVRPETLLIPHSGEGWPDHTGAARLARAAMQLSGTAPTEVYEYCVWMWYYNVWRGLSQRDAIAIHATPAEHRLKQRAIDAYVLPIAPCGTPWSGNLPALFLTPHRSPLELFFKNEDEKIEN